MAPAAVVDLFGGPTPVWEHTTPKHATIQASVLNGPKQLHLVGALIGVTIGPRVEGLIHLVTM
jgi:hypothetical protein